MKTFKDTAPWASKYINFRGQTKGKNFQIKAPSPVVPSKIAASVRKIPSIIDPLWPYFKFKYW